MAKIVSSKDFLYLSDIQPEKARSFFEGYVGENANDRCYSFLCDLEQTYPGFKKWFYGVVIPGLKRDKPDREIIFLIPENDDMQVISRIEGLAILKNTSEEKKICSFRILEGHRNNKGGEALMKECFKYLGTDKPLITVSDNCYNMFKGLFKKFDFMEKDALKDYYTKGQIEHIFNGTL